MKNYKDERLLKVSLPTKQTPGYLRRMQRGLSLKEQFENGKANSKTIMELAEFLADYVTEPTDRKEAVDILLDASEDELLSILDSVNGEKETISPKASEK